MKKSTEPQKSAVVTLRAAGSTLTFAATRLRDGRVRTTVVARDAAKKTERGMSAEHPDMDAAKAHITGLVKAAEKLGWARAVRTHKAAPDAFSKLPAPPKAA